MWGCPGVLHCLGYNIKPCYVYTFVLVSRNQKHFICSSGICSCSCLIWWLNIPSSVLVCRCCPPVHLVLFYRRAGCSHGSSVFCSLYSSPPHMKWSLLLPKSPSRSGHSGDFCISETAALSIKLWSDQACSIQIIQIHIPAAIELWFDQIANEFQLCWDVVFS